MKRLAHFVRQSSTSHTRKPSVVRYWLVAVPIAAVCVRLVVWLFSEWGLIEPNEIPAITILALPAALLGIAIAKPRVAQI